MAKSLPRRIDFWAAVGELLPRDPQYRRLVGSPLKDQQDARRMSQFSEELREKWGCTVKRSHGPGEIVVEICLGDHWTRDRIAGALSYEANFHTFAEGTAGWARRLQRPTSNRTPLATFQVDLSGITLWDLDKISKEFRRALRSFLRSRPAWSGAVPPQLAFLQTVRTEQFFKDLRRYDLYMEQRLSCRKIAAFEKAIDEAREKGRTLTVDDCLKVMPGPVSGSAQRESSVRASVKRIFEAIYRRTFRARRSEMDTTTLSFAARRRIPVKGRKVSRILPSAWEKSTT
jgi:hypothetical protein